MRAPQEIGRRLRAVRELVGLSQVDFAGRAGIKLSAYNQIEHGRTRPSISSAIRLADEYDLTLDYIYLGDDGGLTARIADGLRTMVRARADLHRHREPAS